MYLGQQQTGKSCFGKQTPVISSPTDQILIQSQASRPVIQDFVPLAKSLEWNLGQTYLKERGSAAFTTDASPVPFVVNNDGTLSRHAAEVFYESLEASGAEQVRQGATNERREEEDLYVLELGVGVGLFARFFLDHFKELCRKNGRDYYQRLCYILADKSPRMLLDVCRHGILAGHAGHYRRRVVEALKVDEALPFDVAFGRRPDCESGRGGQVDMMRERAMGDGGPGRDQVGVAGSGGVVWVGIGGWVPGEGRPVGLRRTKKSCPQEGRRTQTARGRP